MRLLFLFLALQAGSLLNGQNHDYYWYLGYQHELVNSITGSLTIDFNFNPPHIFPEKKEIDFGAYAAVCSDSSGQKVLFSTNGISIRNPLQHLMENGDTINPGYLWEAGQNDYYGSDSRLCYFPAPGLPNQYYLIHLSTQLDLNSGYSRQPLYYSLIDMNANNGLGRVIKKIKS